MAANKKYAGLPDLDAAPEIYETPELTDDASTEQTNTLRTDSPAPSDDINENYDRSHVDREAARRRFEPAIVEAKDANFSYAVGGNQKSYTTRRRRNIKYRRAHNGGEEYGDLSDSDLDIEETLNQKIARLKREAEEVRLEIERREKEDGEFKDSLEHQQGTQTQEEAEAELANGMEELGQMLEKLQASAKSTRGSLEQGFIQSLNDSKEKQLRSGPYANTSGSSIPPSTISAIASVSDRLTAIESALGLSSLTPTPDTSAILPTLQTLTSQINLLQSTISPNQPLSTASQGSTSGITPQMPHLDILQSRLHTLHQSASNLLTSRKQAQTALTDLENIRLRGKMTAEHLTRYQTKANLRAGRPTSTTYSRHDTPTFDETNNSRPTSLSYENNNHQQQQSTSYRPGTTATSMLNETQEKVEIADEILTPLFLEDQSDKIRALYTILPTIQNLQPLLPLVLDRLRALSVVHASAASARADMDDIEARLRDWEVELGRWREAVEDVERGIDESKEVMKENVEVVGGLVRGVEERLVRL